MLFYLTVCDHANPFVKLNCIIHLIHNATLQLVFVIIASPINQTLGEYSVHKANLLGIKNSLMRLKNYSSAVYLPGD